MKGVSLNIMSKEIILKYGCNPHQNPAKLLTNDDKFPFEILNGTPGYINFLDAFNAWQLVKELRSALNMPAAASFKHVSPAGAAIGVPLTDELNIMYHTKDLKLSPLACAYARARGADRVSSFGDFIALSDIVDVSTAKLISKEVSDGVIALGYEPEALEILKAKQKGRYIIIKMDEKYEPGAIETREIYGMSLSQKRNNVIPVFKMLENIVTKNKEIPVEAKKDLIIAMVTLKYTQSNSVCYTYNGQVIGCGAGQQSRIHCTRMAGMKADTWFLRHHPKLLKLKFKEGVTKIEKDNMIDQFIRDDSTRQEVEAWNNILNSVPERFTKQEKVEWISKFKGVSLGSDAFFPFRDNIDRAAISGVKYIVQPGGSVRDEIVINACDEYGMVMAYSNLRLFHH